MSLAGLHVISDRSLAGGELVPVLAAAAEGGAVAIHLREPDLSARELFDLAVQVRRALPPDVLFIVNDRVDVALACGADGAQLGTRGMPVEVARRIVPAHFLLGRSVHSVAEALAAEDADYLLVGTIYPSRSHPGQPGAGTALIRAVCDAVPQPIIAIGGITPQNAPDVLTAGADGVAVISAVVGAADPRAAARLFSQSHAGVNA